MKFAWRLLGAVTLLAVAASASDRGLTITSVPSGAQVAINADTGQFSQECVTPCNLKYPDLYFDSAGGQFEDQWKKRLGVPLNAVVSADGRVSKALELTRKRDWTYKEFGRIISRPFYYITSRSFQVVLDQEIDYLAQGREQMQKSDFAEASASFLKAIERDSLNPTCHYMAAQAYGKISNWDGAAEQMRRAVELGSARPEWLYELAGIYHNLRRDADAEAVLIRALALSPNFDAAVELAEIRFRAADFRAAADYFEKALAVSESAPVYSRLGECRRQLGDFPAAIRAYEKALTGGADSSELRENLGAAYFTEAKQYLAEGAGAPAAYSFQKAIDRNPSLAVEAHYLIAEAETAAGSYASANEAWRKMIDAMAQHGPVTPEDYLRLGTAYSAVGDYRKATWALRVSVEREPNPHAWLLLSGVESMTFQFASALFSAEQAGGQRDAAFLTARCRALAGLGRYTDAVSDCRESRQLDHSSPEALYYLGVAYEELHRLGEALASYESYLEETSALHSLDAYSHFLRGNARLSMAQLRTPAGEVPAEVIVAAIGDFTRAVNLQETFARALYNLGLACVRLGRSEDARMYLENLKKLNDSEKDRELADMLMEAIRGMQKR